ncbi:MAG TPA: hypothetical protein VLB00_15890 [Gemmatimonadales bacterium]|nr:hypothetical protein [Gemmatimonadales bacterium]
MSVAALLVLLQGTVTVGDTVWIERAVSSVGSSVLRPQVWTVGSIGQQLGPAEVRIGADGAVVRYALVLWYPGEHLLTMPGPVVVKRDGSSDTLPPSSVRVRVTSVLPAGAPRVTLPPKPARTPVSLAERSLLPLAAILLVIALLWGVIAWLWRRRGALPPVPPPKPTAQVFHDPETLSRWAAAGEHRVALDGWGWILARRMHQSSDLGEIGRIQKVVDEIADSVFSPRGPDYFAALCRRAEEAATG